jgi:beta-phosphoglucomutase-like phosphatase (HAD superfamily)
VSTPFQGATFDVDGVLVDSPHEMAWRQPLGELMESELAVAPEHAMVLEDASPGVETLAPGRLTGPEA